MSKAKAILPQKPFRPVAVVPAPTDVLDLRVDREDDALREIAANADLIMVGKQHFILAAVSPETFETLACLGSEEEDMELDNEDNDLSDLEPSLGWTASCDMGGNEDLEDDNDSGFADTDSVMDEEVHDRLLKFATVRSWAAYSRRFG